MKELRIKFYKENCKNCFKLLAYIIPGYSESWKQRTFSTVQTEYDLKEFRYTEPSVIE